MSMMKCVLAPPLATIAAFTCRAALHADVTEFEST